MAKNNETLSAAAIERATKQLCTPDSVIEFKKFEDIKVADLLELKKAYSAVNNLITKKLTEAFILKLGQWGLLNEDEVYLALKQAGDTNSNQIGFDFAFESKGKRILAEVKANLSYKGNRYGAAQIKGIEDDLLHLRFGKKTDSFAPEDAFKFFVQLHTNESREAMKAIVAKMAGKVGAEIHFANEPITLECSKEPIYIVLLEV